MDKKQKLIDAIASGDSRKIREVKPQTRYIIITGPDDNREFTREQLEEFNKKGFYFTDEPNDDPIVVKIH